MSFVIQYHDTISIIEKISLCITTIMLSNIYIYIYKSSLIFYIIYDTLDNVNIMQLQTDNERGKLSPRVIATMSFNFSF